MTTFIKKRIFSGFFILFFALYQPLNSLADEPEDIPRYQKKLDRLQQSILNIQEHLKDARSHRGHTLIQLQKLESEISNNARSLKKTETKIKKIDKRIAQLKKSLNLLSHKLKKQKFVLAEQLRAARKQTTTRAGTIQQPQFSKNRYG